LQFCADSCKVYDMNGEHLPAEGWSQMAEPSAEAISRPKRPFGVTMIAVILVISSPTAALGWLVQDSPFGLDEVYQQTSDVISTLFALSGIVLAVGLWRLKRWAWVGAMIWFGVEMAGSLIAWRQGEPHYALMGLGIISVFYLNQRDVQRAFGTARHREYVPPPPPLEDQHYGHA
jgi:hypothetical protein